MASMASTPETTEPIPTTHPTHTTHTTHTTTTTTQYADPTPCPILNPFQQCNPSNNTTELTQQDLYGGAITMSFGTDFKDISHIRVVPDHQEVWTDTYDNTIIVELLNCKDIPDTDAGQFFFTDLAESSDAGAHDLSYSGVLDHAICPEISTDVVKCGAVGSHVVSKFHDEDKSGTSARNQVMVYVINLRLKEVGTDMLVTMYRTIQVGETSSTTEVKEIETRDHPDFPSLGSFMAMVGTIKIVSHELFG